MIIDFHNHYYPPAYMEAIQRGPSNIRIRIDDAGNPEIHYPGDYNIAVRGHRDIAFRSDDVRKQGVDMQVISLTTPGTHYEEPKRAAELARITNDDFAKAAADYRGQFIPLATLPLCDPAASVKEFDRAIGQLDFRGAMLFSNVNGVPLADERFWPLYERASDAKAILHIHPVHPVGVEAMIEYWLMPLVGFLMDTTLAAAHLVFAGVPHRFPGIRWVLGHLGGAVPYIAERFDRGYEAFAECRRNIDRPPSEYLKEFYYDTVNFDPNALRLAIAFAGVDQILAGSDYPHQIGSIPKMLASLRSLNLPPADEGKILGGNAKTLLGL